MNLRFLNLAIRNMTGRGAPFSLYRIHPANLFYLTARERMTEERSADPENLEKAQLPRATISFDWPCQKVQSGWMNFMSMGNNGNSVIAVDNVGRTILYDAELNTVRSNLPMMRRPIWDPISATVGDNLYVMGAPGSAPHMHSFEALIQDIKSVWYWHRLQPPPFACPSADEDPSCYHYSDDGFVKEVEGVLKICSHTVFGDSQIWISTVGAGTYSFDTENGEWIKSGDWMLPFRGQAEYVPEYNLWFGFSNNYEQLCAHDLTPVSAGREPVLHMAWNDMAWPKSWIPTATSLVPLGFGVEVERNKEGLRMVRHKTKRYSFGCNIAKAL
ncbi:unnamed protein product [Alopecurus aequalis]